MNKLFGRLMHVLVVVVAIVVILLIKEKYDVKNEDDGQKQRVLVEAETIVETEAIVETEVIMGTEVVDETISANDIKKAPVKWIANYPKVSSDKTLEEKMQERASLEETLAVNEFDKSVIENSTIDFSDVKITVMGDSITAAINLEDEIQAENSLPFLLKEILGCKEAVNLGIGGSSVSRLGDYAMVDRYVEIEKDSDIIIVFGGSNDCLFITREEFGEINGDNTGDESTFCKDLNELCADIQYEYQEQNEENYCKLLYINPPSTVLSYDFYNGDPENRPHQSEFAEAINTIAPKHGFEVIDLYNNNILNSIYDDVDQGLVADGIHMSEEGYRILAEHIASQIIQRIEE